MYGIFPLDKHVASDDIVHRVSVEVVKVTHAPSAMFRVHSGKPSNVPPTPGLLPMPEGYDKYPYNICNDVNEKITREEREWCCDRFKRLEKIARIDTENLQNVTARQAKFDEVKAALRQNVGPHDYNDSVRNQADPNSGMIQNLQSLNPKAYASVLRAWKVFDLLLASEDHCDLMLETLLVQIYTEFINVEVDFGKDEYSWNVFDVRSFLSIVCCSNEKNDPFYLSDTEDQKTAIKLAKANNWSRTEEVLDHKIFWREETDPETQLKRRRNLAFDLFSPTIKLRIDYYTDLYRVMRTYESFSQILSQIFLFVTENPQDNNRLALFDNFVDQVATYTMDNFSEFVYKLPGFRDFVQSALEPLSESGRKDWKDAVHWKVLDARDDSASLWDFKGNLRKHYLYRDIDIFDFEKRDDFVNQIVQYRFKDEVKKAKDDDENEARLFLFLERVQHYMYGMDLIPPELFDSDETWEQVNVFDFDFIKYFFSVFDYPNTNSITLWTLDAIMDIVLGRKDFITPERVQFFKMELGSTAQNPEYEKELREDAPIVQRTDKVLRQLFAAFTSYNPERMRDLRNDSQQAVELVKKYSFQKRVQDNLDRLNLNTKNPIGTFDDDWGAEQKSFTDPNLVEEVKRLTPFLDHNRRLVERIKEFDDDWKVIQRLCRLDVVPWLFINMMTGKVTDPSSGNTYGYPGSDAHKSEIQRRLAGIPSMYWYADPPVRSMPRVDIRRLHGGDGFLFAPRIIPPTPDDDWFQWLEDVKTYEKLVGRLTPFEMAEMFAYSAPPTQPLMKTLEREFVQAKDLLKRSNANQQLVTLKEDTETLAEIRTQRLVTDDFNLESGVTLSEAASYIERWWDKNATLMSDMPRGKDGVQIVRSAISGAQVKQRFLDQWERMQEFKTKENQLEREYARGQGTLEQQMQGRMERYKEFKKQRERLAQHLDDLEKGRISDPVILQDYEDFKKKSKEKWNQLSPRYDDADTYDLKTGDGMNTVPFYIFGRFIGELMDGDESLTFIEKFKAKYGNNIYEDDDDDNTTVLDINDRYMFAWFMRSSSLNDAVWKDWFLEYSEKAPYMPFDIYQSRRRLPTLQDAFDDPRTGTLRRREYEGVNETTDDDTKRQRLQDGSKSGGRGDIGTFFNQFCRRMASMRIKF